MDCVFNNKQHLKFSLIFALILFIGTGFTLNIIALLIGTLFPDCDKRGTLIGTIIPLWLIFKHRGFTHKIYGLILFTGIVSYFYGYSMVGVSFGLGYLLHLIMDSFTPRGIKWI